MQRLKAQASMEHVITFAVALIIISIVVAVWFFGVAPVVTNGTVVPGACSFANIGIQCQDILLLQNGGSSLLVLSLVNSQQYPLSTPSLYVGTNGKNTSAFACSPNFVLSGGSILCIATLPYSTSLNQYVTGQLYLNGNYCLTQTGYLATHSCQGGMNEVYAGSFDAHAQPEISSSSSITLLANSTHQPINDPDGLTAIVKLYGYNLRGATVLFSPTSTNYPITPNVTLTNGAGTALSSITGRTAGIFTVTATYASISAPLSITFVATTSTSTTTSTTVSTTSTMCFIFCHTTTSTTTSSTTSGTTTGTTTSTATTSTIGSTLFATLGVSPSTIYVGQGTTLEVDISGGTLPYGIILYTSTTPSCSSPVQIATASNNYASTWLYTDYPTSSTYYCAYVYDSAGHNTYTNVVYVTVNIPPTSTTTVTTVTTTSTISIYSCFDVCTDDTSGTGSYLTTCCPSSVGCGPQPWPGNTIGTALPVCLGAPLNTCHATPVGDVGACGVYVAQAVLCSHTQYTCPTTLFTWTCYGNIPGTLPTCDYGTGTGDLCDGGWTAGLTNVIVPNAICP